MFLPAVLLGKARHLGARCCASRIDSATLRSDTGWIEQHTDRICNRVRIAQMFVPIGEKAAHYFREIVIGSCRTSIFLFVVSPLEHGEHLKDANAAGTWRRRCDDVETFVIALEGSSFDGSVRSKIF